MTEPAVPNNFDAPPKRDSIPRWIIPVALAALMVAAAIAIVLVAGRQGAVDAPPLPADFILASPIGESYRVFDVREVRGSTVTISSLTASDDELLEVQFSATARLELLDHATLDDIALGQWVTVIGVPNEVFNFSIISIIIFSEFSPAPGNLAITPGGFYGHEAGRSLSKNDVLRPVLGGEVIAIGEESVTLTGPDGDITLQIFPGAPLFILTQATVSDILSGDRLAVHASAGDDPSRAGAILISRPPMDPSLLGAEGLGVGSSPQDAGGEDQPSGEDD